MKKHDIRCAYCGKFIGYKEPNMGFKYTPDNEYTDEEFEYWHKECKEKCEQKLK
jgi:hypothetical protein